MNFKHLWQDRSLRLAQILLENGFETRKVGGSVRDGIANKPSADEDMCTTATPMEMLDLGEKLSIKTIPPLQQVLKDEREWQKGGLKHGTVPFVFENEVFEITTLRVDEQTDGRHANVRFIRSFKEDAARRDFTFNAMSIDPHGNLFDYFGGVEDLKQGRVRFVGDSGSRIQEDYLRILRYFRFHARFGKQETRSLFEHEEATLNSIRANAQGLAKISGERIWQEMGKILPHSRAPQELEAMNACGVLDVIGLPWTANSKNVLERTRDWGNKNPAFALGFLLVGTQRNPAQLREWWKFGNDELEQAVFAYKNLCNVEQNFNFWRDQAVLPKAKPDLVANFLESINREDWANQIRNDLPVFPIKGEDLLALGFKPGPEMGRLLAESFKNWQTSGYTLSKEEMLSPNLSNGFKR